MVSGDAPWCFTKVLPESVRSRGVEPLVHTHTNTHSFSLRRVKMFYTKPELTSSMFMLTRRLRHMHTAWMNNTAAAATWRSQSESQAMEKRPAVNGGKQLQSLR